MVGEIWRFFATEAQKEEFKNCRNENFAEKNHLSSFL